MKYSGALCSGLELHRQYFQEHHNKFESLTFKKSPSITSGTSTPQSFKTSFKNARSPHVRSTKQGSVFFCSGFISPPGQGQTLTQHPSSLWPSEPPAQSPFSFHCLKALWALALVPANLGSLCLFLGASQGPVPAEPVHKTI